MCRNIIRKALAPVLVNDLIHLQLKFLHMFGGLFGKKEDDKDYQFRHRAFMTTAGKMGACARLAKEDPSTLFLTWFSDTNKSFKTFFAENGVDENRVVDARHFHAAQLATHKAVFAEHHPLLTKEEELVKSWNIMNIPVYSAMDEPLFKHFGSEKMIPMMKMMGMKESEVIEHSLVSKSIIKGQEKIAEQVVVEQAAHSQQEWMEKNLK